MKDPGRSPWLPENKYWFLFVSLLSLILLGPIAQEWSLGIPFTALLFLLCTLTALWAAGTSSRWMWFLGVLATIIMLGGMVTRLESRFTLNLHVPISALLLLTFYTIFAISRLVKHVFTETRVTSDTVWGGVAIYVLIGYGFYLLYELARRESSAAFTGPGLSAFTQQTMLYFSFTTLTTVGYGDIVPLSGIARALSSLEAILGPVFLSVFMARLVSLRIAHRN
jgi:hypothetical protein